MAQTAAHLADHVIPPVPVRQWVIYVPKRLRGFLADRPTAVAALTKIFLDEIERLLCAAAGVTRDAATTAYVRPRLGAVSFLHRFGSALNHHVHLHVCATEGVFVPPADGARCDTPPAFLPARPINQADLAALTERVRRRVIRWFRRSRLLDAAAAADMLAWENSGFSVDASVRITLLDRDVPSYFQGLEHLLRYCARPPFALERLSMIRGPAVRIARVRYVLPRHKAANWGGGGAGGSPRGREPMASSNSRRLSSSTGSPISCRRRASTGIGITGCSPRITSSRLPSRHMTKGNMSASRVMPRLVGMPSADMRRTEMPPATAATYATNRDLTTPPGSRGPNSWLGWARSVRWNARDVVATSDSSRPSPSRGRSGRCCHASANHLSRR